MTQPNASTSESAPLPPNGRLRKSLPALLAAVRALTWRDGLTIATLAFSLLAMRAGVAAQSAAEEAYAQALATMEASQALNARFDAVDGKLLSVESEVRSVKSDVSQIQAKLDENSYHSLFRR